MNKPYFVYVCQSQQVRVSKKTGKILEGFFYVGMTTCVKRRLREHNGLYANGKPGNPKGGRYTSRHRPWRLMAIHGPYANRSEAMKAERALKRGKRGKARCHWSPLDSPWCRGLGADDPRVAEINAHLDEIRSESSP